MTFPIRCAVVSTLCALAAANTQGAATDGNTYYQLLTVPTSASGVGGDVAFGATPTSQTFQVWWHYRLAGDARESTFHNGGGQLTQSWGGRTGWLRWSDVDNRGFAADYRIQVYRTGTRSGVVSHRMTVVNRGARPLVISLFAYADLDVCGLFDNLAVPVNGGGRQLVSDRCGDRVELLADNPDRFRVAPYPSLRNALLDGNTDDLDDRGLPFGPGDYSAAFQWRNRVVMPNESLTAAFAIAHNSLGVCGELAAATPYGTALGVGAQVPRFEPSLPFLASSTPIRIADGRPGAVPFLLIGTQLPGIAFPGLGTLYVLPQITLPFAPLDGFGASSIALQVPSRATLCSGRTHFQVVYLEPRLPGGLAHTAGLEWRYGGL
jgi:hypothetical protein